MSKVIREELDIAEKKLVLETGELAMQANASVLVSYGDTVVLATVVSKETALDVNFFPLAVDYEERLYAGGKISTSRFIKREGRPSEEAILTARLIDRSIRPLFPKDYHKEVQVIITVLSVDQENDPDIVSLIAASAALTISDIPWNGPLAGVRVGRQNGGFILNPTEDEKTVSTLDLVLATTKEEIVMIETSASEVDEKSIIDAVKFGLLEAQKIIELINNFQKEAGKPKEQYQPYRLEDKDEEKIREFISQNIISDKILRSTQFDQEWFSDSVKKLKEQFIKEGDDQLISEKHLRDILDDETATYLRSKILEGQKRIDGRKPDEVRPLNIKVGLLPRTHGSGLFQRGETQILSIATLASPALEQLIEGMIREGTKRYMHHYNFPPFSTGEVRRLYSPGRREIGHGVLAEKAIIPILPTTDIFPYTVRVVSEVLSSAGSTSMASVCGSTLALMDAGVPLKEAVAGISIGLVTDKTNKSKYVTLTDIAYQEDNHGDMDFKVAGTKNGITAIQMDIKLNGIPMKIIEEAIEKARKARLFILDKIFAEIPQSREQISKYAPTVIIVKIDPAKIGEVIGSGGKVINRIISETGAAIDINDEGTVTISSKDAQACQKAAKFVEGIVKEAQVGEEYEGTIKRMLPFGAFVELFPGKEGLVHISKFPRSQAENFEENVKIGQKLNVKVAEIDDVGRINLSIVGVEGQSDYRNIHQRKDYQGRGSKDRFDRRRDRRPPRKRY